MEPAIAARKSVERRRRGGTASPESPAFSPACASSAGASPNCAPACGPESVSALPPNPLRSSASSPCRSSASMSTGSGGGSVQGSSESTTVSHTRPARANSPGCSSSDCKGRLVSEPSTSPSTADSAQPSLVLLRRAWLTSMPGSSSTMSAVSSLPMTTVSSSSGRLAPRCKPLRILSSSMVLTPQVKGCLTMSALRSVVVPIAYQGSDAYRMSAQLSLALRETERTTCDGSLGAKDFPQVP